MKQNWQYLKIKDYPLEIIDGDRGRNYPRKSDFLESGFCLFLNTGNVTKSGFSFSETVFITEEQHGSLRKGLLQRNDTILTTRGTIGNTAFYSSSIQYDYIRINSGMLILRPKVKNLLPAYFYQLMKSDIFYDQAKLFSYGAAQPQLPIATLKYILLPLPPLPTQQKIAQILSAYDDLIENNLKRIKLLEEMAQITYEQWFVRMKFPNHKTTPIDAETDLPEGWKKDYIGNNYKTASGGTPSSRNAKYYTNGSIPWVRTQELRNNLILGTSIKITELGLEKSSAKIFPKKTVLLAMYGNTIGETGFIMLPASTNQACCAFLTDEKDSYYLHQYLMFHKQQILNYRMGAAQENISQQIIKKIKILIPDSKIIFQFGEVLSPIYSLVESLTRQNQHLKEARDILLPRLMTGIIDVDKIKLPQPLGKNSQTAPTQNKEAVPSE